MTNSNGKFSKPTKIKIAMRAAYICSNPDCRRLTLIPEVTSETETIYKGKAAHIKDRRPITERYDASMTDEERASPENGIHLCSECADKIDKNKGRDYPVAKLREWKIVHDEWLRNRQKDHAERRRELNKYVSSYFTRDDLYPFDPEQRASGYIIVPEDSTAVSSQLINIRGRVDKTVSGSSYWIAISPQKSDEQWWPQEECSLTEDGFWVIENAKLGRSYPEGTEDRGRKFEIGLYETSSEAHKVFQSAKENDSPVQNTTHPFHAAPNFVEIEAFLLWKIVVTRIA